MNKVKYIFVLILFGFLKKSIVVQLKKKMFTKRINITKVLMCWFSDPFQIKPNVTKTNFNMKFAHNGDNYVGHK